VEGQDIGEARRAKSGWNFLGGGSHPPPHQLGSSCMGSAAEGFSCIMCRQIASPGISLVLQTVCIGIQIKDRDGVWGNGS